MAEEEPVQAEPVFRANKRRKVFRKRADSAEGQNENGDRPYGDATQQATTNNEEDDSISASTGSATQVRRPKKHGIAFSSVGPAPRQPLDEPSEYPLSVAARQLPKAVQQQNERFIKPTGKAVVADDKHMSAFIDSKLAELQSASHTPASTAPGIQPMGPQTTFGTSTEQPEDDLGSQHGDASLTLGESHENERFGRPAKLRRQRQPPARSEADVARDSMIDQIMREGQVPIYDRPDPTSVQAVQSTGAGLDRDAAAAAAFRAEFLAAAEERNLQRRPPAPPTVGGSLGPKLGGSRAQRERMKALEEAKGKSGSGAGGK